MALAGPAHALSDHQRQFVADVVQHGGVNAEIYEPLDHAEPGLPRTLIHVSGSEVLHDARLAAQRLAAVGVPVQLRVWPGQMHVFQIAASMVPEANRSLGPDGQLHPRGDRPKSHVTGRSRHDRRNLSPLASVQ